MRKLKRYVVGYDEDDRRVYDEIDHIKPLTLASALRQRETFGKSPPWPVIYKLVPVRSPRKKGRS
jgi:hypothetical protein